MRTKKFLAMAIALGLAVGMTAMPTLAAEKDIGIWRYHL